MLGEGKSVISVASCLLSFLVLFSLDSQSKLCEWVYDKVRARQVLHMIFIHCK